MKTASHPSRRKACDASTNATRLVSISESLV